MHAHAWTQDKRAPILYITAGPRYPSDGCLRRPDCLEKELWREWLDKDAAIKYMFFHWWKESEKAKDTWPAVFAWKPSQ